MHSTALKFREDGSAAKSLRKIQHRGGLGGKSETIRTGEMIGKTLD